MFHFRVTPELLLLCENCSVRMWLLFHLITGGLGWSILVRHSGLFELVYELRYVRSYFARVFTTSESLRSSVFWVVDSDGLNTAH